MPGVVCAIRGGPESRPTIETSIDIAKEKGLPIYFLFIINLDFLTQTMSSRTHTILKELRQMGDYILLSSQANAEDQGIAAERISRKGDVREEIITLYKEVNADYVVLGSPKGEEKHDVFTLKNFRHFLKVIDDESGAKTILVDRDNK